MASNLSNMADRRWQYVLLLLFSIFMAFSLAGSHLRNIFGDITAPAPDGTFMNHAPVGQVRKEDTDAPMFKVSSQGHFSFAEIPKPRTGVLSKLSPMRRPLIGKRDATPAKFPFYEHEVDKIAEATFTKLKHLDDCIHRHIGYQELSRRKLRTANRQCLVDAFTGLEKLLIATGVEEIGYGGLGSGDYTWEEAGAHYVRAGRAHDGGWFLVRKGGQQDEKDEQYRDHRQAPAHAASQQFDDETKYDTGNKDASFLQLN
ncbi:hypothetical protein DL98DRAFT_655402 [Cadophora sp. DSE1049]|nr:hypothetical protein DL98DRAFT_655402 [Cadophora sp. DSE1049]